MATQLKELPLGWPTGNCYPSRLSIELSLTNSKGHEVIVMPDPAAAGDHGVELTLRVPADYVSTPVLRIGGFLDAGGAPANNLAFSVVALPLADNESGDAAYNTEDLASASVATYSDEDYYEETVALTNSGIAAGDLVLLAVNIDDSASTYTGSFLLASLQFEYSDA